MTKKKFNWVQGRPNTRRPRKLDKKTERELANIRKFRPRTREEKDLNKYVRQFRHRPSDD